LVTLKYISVCQICKEEFNSHIKAPYLLKCGHFFCKFCLESQFTDEKGNIYCPDDGVVASEFKELKILNNLIIEKNNEIEDTHFKDIYDNRFNKNNEERNINFNFNRNNYERYNDKERFFDNERSVSIEQNTIRINNENFSKIQNSNNQESKNKGNRNVKLKKNFPFK